MTFSFYFQLASLFIIVAYAILVFRNVDPLLATAFCVILGFIFNRSTPLEIGNILQSALSSFLATVGFIIMLGRGLGEILNETKISHTLVHRIVYGIGVNTRFRVKLGVVFSSLVIVAVLGTLAGGLAILAPILRPIAASVSLTKPSLAVLMQAAGEEALILGPFAPPVIALLAVTGISYRVMLTHAAIPIVIVTLTTSWIMANKLQKKYSYELLHHDPNEKRFSPTWPEEIATWVFIGIFILCVIYGLIFKASTSFVIFVIIFLSLLMGVMGRLSFVKIMDLMLTGMRKNFHLFMIFILLDPFLNLIQSAGGFNALMRVFAPLERLGGKTMVSILVGLTGAFGMPAASAAVIKMLHEIFLPAALQVGLPTFVFAFSMLLATRITNFAYPGANMFAAMGFANSENIKAMIQNGLVVAAVQTIFLILYSVFFDLIF
ncbi:MAG: permease [Coxiella sp. RIFCSPHIGHO2_12_FULL_42_15]|nr:MAG: permease [Coxiella sp. RIFCSPHIGHO2_12_FULL_42_15]